MTSDVQFILRDGASVAIGLSAQSPVEFQQRLNDTAEQWLRVDSPNGCTILNLNHVVAVRFDQQSPA